MVYVPESVGSKAGALPGAVLAAAALDHVQIAFNGN
jgi:hypothetical protein